MAQTYSNIKIILINDGSNDNSGCICDDWALRDNCIKVIHTKNQGVSHARSVGLNAMTGDYVGFVDADDWIEPDTYECLLRAMVMQNTDVAGGGYVREERHKSVVIFRRESSRFFHVHEF